MQSVNQGGSGPMTDWKAMGGDKKIVSGIVAILLGAFGIHKFLLGYTTEGVIMLVITVVSCGILAIVPSVIGIIEGIIYLTKSDEEFVRTYIQGRKGWF
jgi:TM2 domain-containing membrane protein YozV